MAEFTVKRPKLELSYHRPEWILEYTNMVKEIREMVPNKINLCFMHIGSTAVRGVTARPIIDICVGVINPLDLITVRDILSFKGFNYNEARSTMTDLFMEKRGMGKQRFNIHIVEFDGNRWKGMLEFTQFLKNNQVAAKEYGAFKTDLLFRKNLPYEEYERQKRIYIKKMLDNNK